MSDAQEQFIPRAAGMPKSVLIAFIAMIASGGLLTGWWFAQKRSGRDVLKIAAESLDFGRTPVQKGFVLHLPIDNISDHTVRVLDIRSSCSCTRVAPRTFVLEAGATQDVTLTLDLTPGRLEDYNRKVWDFEVEIAVILDGGALLPSPWKVTGQVVSPFRFPDEALVERQFIRSAECEPTEVQLSARSRLEDLSVTCEPPLGKIRVEHSDSAEVPFKLKVSPADEAPFGPFNFLVTVSDKTQSTELFPASFMFVGQVVHEIEAIPSTVLLRCDGAHGSSEQIVTLRSRVGREFQIAGLIHSDGLTTMEDISTDTRTTQRRFVLKRNIPTSGILTSELRVNLRSHDHPILPLTIPITYLGGE